MGFLKNLQVEKYVTATDRFKFCLGYKNNEKNTYDTDYLGKFEDTIIKIVIFECHALVDAKNDYIEGIAEGQDDEKIYDNNREGIPRDNEKDNYEASCPCSIAFFVAICFTEVIRNQVLEKAENEVEMSFKNECITQKCRKKNQSKC